MTFNLVALLESSLIPRTSFKAAVRDHEDRLTITSSGSTAILRSAKKVQPP